MNFLYESDPNAMSARAFISDLANETNMKDFCLEICHTYEYNQKESYTVQSREKAVMDFIKLFTAVAAEDVKDRKDTYTGWRYFDMFTAVPIICPPAPYIQERIISNAARKERDPDFFRYDILVVAVEPFKKPDPSVPPRKAVETPPMIRADLYTTDALIRRYMRRGVF